MLNGDTLVELDLGALCAFHQQRKAVATLVLRKDPEAERWGLVEMDSNNCIVRITGRGRTDQGPTQPRMFAGIHVLRLRLLRDVPKGVPSTIIDPMWQRFNEERRCSGMTVRGTGRTSGRQSAMHKPNRTLQPVALPWRQDSDLPNRMLKKPASLSCSFGLFSLSGSSGRSGLFCCLTQRN